MKVAVYPGSFDPITNGHLDILSRALKVFDKVIILVAINPDKKARFSIEDRVQMIKEAVKEYQNVEVDSCTGLTVDYAKKRGAKHLIRGIRGNVDFEYEYKLSSANNYIDDSIDMVFFMSKGSYAKLTSSMIIDLCKRGVDISNLVPQSVVNRIKEI